MANAQAGKIYILKNCKYSKDPKYAVAYDIVQKLGDSAFLVSGYNMRDTILWKGSYKDSLLRIPHGKFIYYQKRTIDPRLQEVLHTDTNNFICKIGFYANGSKTGRWIEYEKRGLKKCTYEYKNNVLDGLYEQYDRNLNDYVIQDGHYVNNKKEGEWNFYGYDTLKTPVASQLFKNDKFIKKSVT